MEVSEVERKLRSCVNKNKIKRKNVSVHQVPQKSISGLLKKIRRHLVPRSLKFQSQTKLVQNKIWAKYDRTKLVQIQGLKLEGRNMAGKLLRD